MENGTVVPELQDIVDSNAVAEAIAKILRNYVPFFLLILGVPGNILSFIIMSRPHFSSSTTSLYLRGLAVSDTCYLLFFTCQRLMLGWGLRGVLAKSSIFHGYCAFYHFSSYAAKLFGMYMIIVMTYDRMLGLCFPLKSRSWSTRRAARIAIAVTTIISLIESSPRLIIQYSAEFKTWLCPYFFPMHIFQVYIKYYNIHSSVCGILVLIANTVFVTRLIKNSSERKKLPGESKDNDKSMNARNRQITVMLSVVSFFYVLALIPSAFHFQFWPNASAYMKRQIGWRIFSQETALFFETLNYSINFWLYVFSCSKFRNVLKDLFKVGVKAGAAKRYEASSSTQQTTADGADKKSGKQMAGEDSTHM